MSLKNVLKNQDIELKLKNLFAQCSDRHGQVKIRAITNYCITCIENMTLEETKVLQELLHIYRRLDKEELKRNLKFIRKIS